MSDCYRESVNCSKLWSQEFTLPPVGGYLVSSLTVSARDGHFILQFQYLRHFSNFHHIPFHYNLFILSDHFLMNFYIRLLCSSVIFFFFVSCGVLYLHYHLVVSRQIWLPPFHISVHEQKERGTAEFYLTSPRTLTLPVHLAEEMIVLRIPLAIISTG